jgi:exodeoxyribonuclease V gamma subunit
MERWLTQRMSAALGTTPGRADGVCANVDFPSPRRLVDEAVSIAVGIAPEADAWLPERMVWPLLEVVDGALGEPWLRSLAAHLGATIETADPARQARRFASVRHIADLLDRYALHRPDMVRAWAQGRDVDAAGRRLPSDATWQAELWRRLRARVDQPDPAERIERACARLREQPGLLELPPRLGLFGLTRPAGRATGGARRAGGGPRPARLPAASLAGPVGRADEHAAGSTARRRPDPRRAGEPLARLVGTGRARAATRGPAVRRPRPPPPDPTGGRHLALPPPVRACAPIACRPARRFPAIRTSAWRSPMTTAASRSTPATGAHARSRSFATRSCTLLAEDPTLEPRDVIVMCPDIETFAPLIHATFGAGEVSTADDGFDEIPEELRPPDLRVRLA